MPCVLLFYHFTALLDSHEVVLCNEIREVGKLLGIFSLLVLPFLLPV